MDLTYVKEKRLFQNNGKNDIWFFFIFILISEKEDDNYPLEFILWSTVRKNMYNFLSSVCKVC